MCPSTVLRLLALLAAAACTSTNEGTPSDDTDENATVAETAGLVDESHDPSAADEAGSGDHEDEDGANTIDTPDEGVCGPLHCLPGDPESCGPGLKCTPWDCDDDSRPFVEASRCTKVGGDRQVDETCFRDGVTQTDDCAPGLFCMVDDGLSGQSGPGHCWDLCVPGTEGDDCQGAGLADPHCFAFNNGALPLCASQCDPLGNDCQASDQHCVLDLDGFRCSNLLDNPSDLRPLGDLCDVPLHCEPGLSCISDQMLKGCRSSTCHRLGCGCCAEICDLEAENPTETCTWEGATCVPIFGDATAQGPGTKLSRRFGFCEHEYTK